MAFPLRAILRYWKPIAVFWVLTLLTILVVEYLRPKWVFQGWMGGESLRPASWSNDHGEAYTFYGGVQAFTIDEARKSIKDESASPPEPDLSFLPDQSRSADKDGSAPKPEDYSDLAAPVDDSQE